MKIKKELLQELVGGYDDSDKFEVVQNEIVDSDRWSLVHDCVIKDLETGLFYDASYSVGATEMQDESPFEYAETDENGLVELMEVVPYECSVTKYRKKND
jgi:hypothetical protein